MNSNVIFFLLPRLPSKDIKYVGGGELSNILLINSIAKNNKVIVFPMTSSSNRYPFSHNVQVINSDYNLSGRIGYFFEKYFFYYKRLYKYSKKYHPGKVIATRSTIYSANNLKLIFKCKFEIIIRAYEDFINIKKFDPYSKSSFLRIVERYIFKRKLKNIYKNVDRFITNSKFMAHSIQNDLGTSINNLVIYPEINLPRIRPKFKEIEKIGFINRGKKKGEKTIIELSKENPLIQFLIFGDCISTKQRNIINMGYFNDRSEMFRLIDIVLMPSLWNEPYGRVAAEAIWSGKMVLVSKRGGLPEAAPDNFFLVDSISVKEWDRKLKELVKMNKLVESSIIKAQVTLSNYNNSYY